MPELLVMGAHTSGSALSTKKGVDIIVQSSEFILCVQLSLSAMPNEHVRSTQQYFIDPVVWERKGPFLVVLLVRVERSILMTGWVQCRSEVR